ncbi:unnamed protein product [Cylicocyclus nassatus]|uniref:ANK_REP_REGION domain-containing protein n=1 Tax=Cylicocyclus nassatus TaxID=53992 RepID=A0AA36DKN1_CYLNA|nr:unnamed protein product [Cylicocyclus nassatus]
MFCFRFRFRLKRRRKKRMQSHSALQLDFLEQCTNGDASKVRNMIAANMVDVSYQHPINGWTALHWAARRGYEEICVLLLAHGFSREVRDKKGRTPFDVCAEDNIELREILRPDSIECKECHEIMPSAVEKRRHSEETDGDEKFVPNYIRHPPFPYVSKASSFDYGTKAPPSPTITNGYFSYGRRDSINKTRFLLVRTCFTDGKQAFKRVTLPGGSTVEQLKKMVERSMRNGKVEAIFTLPDRVLVEDDSQIAQFSDCQRVEVVYADEDPSPEVGEKIIDIRPNGSMEKEGEQQEVHITETSETAGGGGDSFPITLMESFSNEQPDSSTAAQEENLSNEGSIPIEKIPSMDVTPVETEDNNHSEVESAQKISLRKSIDSDPGDFVKIETPDNGNSAAEVKSATPPTPPVMVSSTSKEEEKKEAEGLEAKKKAEGLEAVEKVEVKPEPQPQVGVVKLEKKPKDRSLGTGLLTWMDENPNIVRCCATTAAVVGLAGIASFVYARRIRSGGF